MVGALGAGDLQGSIRAGCSIAENRVRRAFWLFVLGHVVVWTLVPVITRHNAPLDTVELIFWGHEWRLGYPKHPPLPAWISEALWVTAGGSMGALYLAAQACVVLCFWAVWRLGLEIVAPRTALFAVFLLECCYYYNHQTAVLNNNTVLYPCWALAVLFLHRALRTGNNRFWLAFATSVALGLLTKYSMLTLLLPMLAFGIGHRKARAAWLRPGPCLAILLALLICAPHIYWAVSNGFPTINYITARTESSGRLAGHLLNPLKFGAAQLLALLPLLIVARHVTGYRWRLRAMEPSERFDRDFLVVMTLGPVLLHLALSLLTGANLRSMYGCQLWMFVGLLTLFCLQLQTATARWRRLAVGCATWTVIFLGLTITHDVLGPLLRGKTSRTHFPGRELAAQIDALWSQRYGEALRVVAGQWWLSGNVALYGPSRPSVYEPAGDGDAFGLSPGYCTWMEADELQERGGVILWDHRRFPDGHPELRRRFPHAEKLPPLTLAYRTAAEIPPARVGVAIVPPRDPARSIMLLAQRESPIQ